MKLSTKPISSPGRTNKFPLPLMRFLRSNVGSKSRGKSRSSPMFVRKKNAAIETQESSSPKVKVELFKTAGASPSFKVVHAPHHLRSTATRPHVEPTHLLHRRHPAHASPPQPVYGNVRPVSRVQRHHHHAYPVLLTQYHPLVP
jgi:hypothetical protein